MQDFGFVEGQAPPGMIYRHLRQLEDNGLVSSEWETAEAGPAKRVYCLTGEGEEVLGIWIKHMEEQVKKLSNFVRLYRKLLKKKDLPLPTVIRGKR
jgi:DNA-binding PadR family transcriptional regulator